MRHEGRPQECAPSSAVAGYESSVEALGVRCSCMFPPLFRPRQGRPKPRAQGHYSPRKSESRDPGLLRYLWLLESKRTARGPHKGGRRSAGHGQGQTRHLHKGTRNLSSDRRKGPERARRTRRRCGFRRRRPEKGTGPERPPPRPRPRGSTGQHACPRYDFRPVHARTRGRIRGGQHPRRGLREDHGRARPGSSGPVRRVRKVSYATWHVSMTYSPSGTCPPPPPGPGPVTVGGEEWGGAGRSGRARGARRGGEARAGRARVRGQGQQACTHRELGPGALPAGLQAPPRPSALSVPSQCLSVPSQCPLSVVSVPLSAPSVLRPQRPVHERGRRADVPRGVAQPGQFGGRDPVGQLR